MKNPVEVFAVITAGLSAVAAFGAWSAAHNTNTSNNYSNAVELRRNGCQAVLDFSRIKGAQDDVDRAEENIGLISRCSSRTNKYQDFRQCLIDPKIHGVEGKIMNDSIC